MDSKREGTPHERVSTVAKKVSTDEKFGFVEYVDNGGSAVMIGTLKDAKSAVFNINELHYLLDEDGVRIGMTMATVDGLEHGVNNEQCVSAAASYVCEQTKQIFRRPNPSPAILKQQIITIGQNVKKEKIRHGKSELALHQEEDSLAFTGIKYDEKGQLYGLAANVGASMVVILEGKTRVVKQTLPAKVYSDTKKEDQFRPMTVQRATNDTIDVAEVKIAEGDIVIHLTPGIWSELALKTTLESNDKSSLRKIKTTQLDADKFIALLTETTSHGLAKQIVDAACKAAITEGKILEQTATVAVMQVPILKVELARALLTHPKRALNLIERLIKITPTEENEQKAWKDDILQQLGAEHFIPREADATAAKRNEHQPISIYNNQQKQLLFHLLDFVILSKNSQNNEAAWMEILSNPNLSPEEYENLSNFSFYLGYSSPPYNPPPQPSPSPSPSPSLLEPHTPISDGKEAPPVSEEKRQLLSVFGVRSRQSIDKVAFNRIIDAYKSTSCLLTCCCGFFSKRVSPYRSKAIRELRRLADNSDLFVTKEQIETALKKDSSHRIELFKVQQKKNNTSTDEVISALQQEFCR